jgi:tetratricopeptide (TPR) repeat protein
MCSDGTSDIRSSLLDGNTKSSVNSAIEIFLFGAFKITSDQGVDLTPTSVKAQALIALISASPDRRRSRAWLQHKLWSTRGSQQAAGSLRQALLEIRQALGEHKEVLRASKTAVELTTTQVRIRAIPDGPAAETQFLQGLDAKDPQFEDWLLQMRAYYAGQAAITAKATETKKIHQSRQQQRLTAVVDFSKDGQTDQIQFQSTFSALLCRSLQDHMEIEFLPNLPNGNAVSALGAGILLLRVQNTHSESKGTRVRVAIEELATLRCFWIGEANVPTPLLGIEENVEVLSLIHQMVLVVLDLVANRRLGLQLVGGFEAAILSSTAFRKMFTMRHEELQLADELLRQAIEISPRGLYYAWRAQLATIRLIERQAHNKYELQLEANHDTAIALEKDCTNSNVLASAANARLVFDGDCDASLVLARQSVLANRTNPLAWWSWANATLYGGQPNLAYAAAITAGGLAEGSSLKFWADFQVQLTAAVNGRYDEAIQFGTSANALAPNFRPALRYLLALYGRVGAVEASSRALRKLRTLENDFSIERLVEDPTYPVSMMRRAGLAQRELFVGIEDFT